MVSREPHAQRYEAEDLVGLPDVGEVFQGKYRIEGRIGIGGMAVVLAARHLCLDDRVALKLLLPRWTEDPELVDRFLGEGRAASRIHSEHVVRVFDEGLVFGRPYLVMEYLEGADLEAVVAARGPMPVAVAVDLLLQTCEAIAEAHSFGIIHRDLKPANLFLTHRADGSPCMKVLDFGISKVLSRAARVSGIGDSHTTLPSAVMGSPHYMSPEQMQSSRDVDMRSDIWALGAILHEMLSARPPFVAESSTALCARILRDPPTPLSDTRSDVPPSLEAAVLRCLEKLPDRRYATVAELARALSAFGTQAARTSAERITRVIEGNAEPSAILWSPAAPPRLSTLSPSTSPPRASELLEGAPRPPMRPMGGYVMAAILLVSVAAAAGWGRLRGAQSMERTAAGASERASVTSAPLPAEVPPLQPPPLRPLPSATAPGRPLGKTPAMTASPAPSSHRPGRAPRRPAPSIPAGPRDPPSSADTNPYASTTLAPIAEPGPAVAPLR